MSFTGKKILITGGTGAIGKHLIKKLLNEKPALIRVYSRDEYKQYVQYNELKDYGNLQYIIGDVRNYVSLYNAMADMDFVFHLAAMKHVPACENHPYEAVQTNVKGTYNVIQAAGEQQVNKVLLSSSDKAVSPTNTYGATKLMAERMIQATEQGEHTPTIAVVRFGNVMGSRGSVIPLFQKQITTQSSITVTDLEMTRFMMTPDQAVTLMIKAITRSQGGEVFVLKMPVIKLKDLANVVINRTCEQYGLNHHDIQIVEMGLRPGEKRYEELMTYDESLKAYDLGDMFSINGPAQSTSPRVTPGTYDSNQPTPISKEEIIQLLQEENLLKG
ncbi:polysaccharide biosynthesis protein [Alkalibacillus silvisoli]|uniref:SDR family NAD(P)-dependent oxidoreductase n=1 Tax=Alkalibacillus silvisoli TaxID=392823 RepID=A0ABN0ZNT9_9BACI